MAPKPRARPSNVPVADAKLSRQSVTGVFRPKASSPVPHHLGWDEAFEDALKLIKRPKGQYQVHVDFSAILDVTNPGSVIEYHVTLV
jgi:hypothetical protein